MFSSKCRLKVFWKYKSSKCCFRQLCHFDKENFELSTLKIYYTMQCITVTCEERIFLWIPHHQEYETVKTTPSSQSSLTRELGSAWSRLKIRLPSFHHLKTKSEWNISLGVRHGLGDYKIFKVRGWNIASIQVYPSRILGSVSVSEDDRRGWDRLYMNMTCAASMCLIQTSENFRLEHGNLTRELHREAANQLNLV